MWVNTGALKGRIEGIKEGREGGGEKVCVVGEEQTKSLRPLAQFCTTTTTFLVGEV